MISKKRLLVPILFLLSACSGGSNDGMAAYKAGDYEAAAKQFAPLADKGDAQAQLHLGLMYAYGRGVEADLKRGIDLISASAKSGNAEAMGYMSALNDGDAGSKLSRWYRKGADNGIAEAQYRLGVLYSTGEGVSKDFTQAAQWYRKAAEQGLADAELDLGHLYFAGKGVAQSRAEAIGWYRKAAENGLPSAQYVLGLVYCGSSCDVKNEDSILSYMLFSLAAAANVENAASYRDAVSNLLSQAELTQAQAAVTAWKKGSPIPNIKAAINRAEDGKSRLSSQADGASAEISRDQFKAAVVGKTPDQVLRIVGAPDDTNESANRTSWVYRYKTHDPLTGKTDQMAIVVFMGGVAHHVMY